jgi:hypothetical protein
MGTSCPNNGSFSIPFPVINGVQMGPGATEFTRIPFLLSYSDKARVNAVMAPLVEV